MYLKEAFRYQNCLNDLINKTRMFLNDKSVIMTTTEEHLRTKANPEAIDEKIDKSSEKPIEFDADLLIAFMDYLVNRKFDLCEAINEAKHKCDFDIDAAIQMNKVRQDVAEILSKLSKVKPTERITTGYGTKFNAEGNQVRYQYDIKEVSTINYDRNAVKTLASIYHTRADDVSHKIDMAMLNVEVDFIPDFDVNDTYEDIIEKISSKLTNK